MPSYAAFDDYTQQYLQGEADDTYIRPIFSIMPDDPEGEFDDHNDCPICHGNEFGARWVPDNGGAWVNSGYWQQSRLSIESYSRYNI